MKNLVSLVGLLVCTGGWAQVGWELSDALGTDLGPSANGGSGSGWVLRIEPRKGGEERTLFQNGKAQSVRLVDLNSEDRVLRVREVRNGLSTWEVEYDPATGLPRTEISFENNRPVESATLFFENRKLVSRTVEDPAGYPLFTDTLYRWPNGTLRRMERDGLAGPKAEASWSYGPGGKLVGIWSVDGENRALGEHREWAYGDRKTEETLAKGTDVLESRVTEWLAAGGTRETRKETASNETETKVLDPRGNPLSSVVSINNNVTQTRKWTYDSTGRIIKTTAETPGILEIWVFIYPADGTVHETLTRNGSLVREEILRDGETVKISLFDRGVLFLVEDWAAGKLTKESYYSQGTLVRERKP